MTQSAAFFAADPYRDQARYQLKDETSRQDGHYLTYEKSHSYKWRAKKGVQAFFATLFTGCFGLLSDDIQKLWKDARSGKELKVIKIPLKESAEKQIFQDTVVETEHIEAPQQQLTPVDFSLKTNIYKKMTDGTKQPIKFQVYLRESPDEFLCYRIKAENEKMQLGDISMVCKTDHVFIDRMNAWHKDYENVGRAMHEIAVKVSHEKKHSKIKLVAGFGSDGFHFKCGFRYENPLAATFGNEKDTLTFKALIDQYFKNKNDGHSNETVLKQIDGYQAYLESMKNCAEKHLHRKPLNIDEIIEHGAYYDMNRVLHAVYNDPSQKVDLPIYSNKTFKHGGTMVLATLPPSTSNK